MSLSHALYIYYALLHKIVKRNGITLFQNEYLHQTYIMLQNIYIKYAHIDKNAISISLTINSCNISSRIYCITKMRRKKF